MTAIRLARGFTGRDRVVKFAGGYHGHGDALLAESRQRRRHARARRLGRRHRRLRSPTPSSCPTTSCPTLDEHVAVRHRRAGRRQHGPRRPRRRLPRRRCAPSATASAPCSSSTRSSPASGWARGRRPGALRRAARPVDLRQGHRRRAQRRRLRRAAPTSWRRSRRSGPCTRRARCRGTRSPPRPASPRSTSSTPPPTSGSTPPPPGWPTASPWPCRVPSVGPGRPAGRPVLLAATPRDYDEARTTDTERFARFFHAMLDRGVALAPGRLRDPVPRPGPHRRARRRGRRRSRRRRHHPLNPRPHRSRTRPFPPRVRVGRRRQDRDVRVDEELGPSWATDRRGGGEPRGGSVERLLARDHTLWQDDPTEVADRLGLARLPDDDAGATSAELDGPSPTAAAPTGSSGSWCSAWAARRCSPRCWPGPSGSRPGPASSSPCSTPPTRPRSARVSTDWPRRHATLVRRGVEVRHHHRDPQPPRALLERPPATRRASPPPPIPAPSSARVAAERGFRATFENPADIGGRYSALSLFGLVPAALAGVDLGRSCSTARQRRSPTCAPRRPARLPPSPAAWPDGPGQADLRHRPRASPVVRALGRAAARRVHGQARHRRAARGGRALGPPEAYGADRLFVAIGELAARPTRRPSTPSPPPATRWCEVPLTTATPPPG